MTFKDYLEKTPIELFYEKSLHATQTEIDAAIRKSQKSLADFAVLISPLAIHHFKTIARLSQQITQQRFGKVIQIYAPLYLSNECADTCTYCGFSRENKIVRRTLSLLEAEGEARYLIEKGIKHILLVTGEHPHAVPSSYIEDIIRHLHTFVPSISLEVAPQKESIYAKWVNTGADGLVVYQETYQKYDYQNVHLAGKKKDYDWRLETPERAARAGMRKIGIGILLGLADWRKDAITLAAHALYLQKYYWRTQFQISLPRLRSSAGNSKPRVNVTDSEMVQIFCALRLLLPDTGLVLSTRECPELRNAMIGIGITQMSAGSKTEPGGYLEPHEADVQFEIEDQRDVEEVIRAIRSNGYEAISKDWEQTLCAGLPRTDSAHTITPQTSNIT